MTQQYSLQRTLGFSTVTFYGVGAILGAGIYVLIGEVAGLAGYAAPLSFIVAAVIAIFSAFSYAELSARFPKSAGEAVYIEQAFGCKWLTITVGLLVILTGIVSAATMTTGIVGYAQVFVTLPSFALITVFVIAISAIAIWGIKQSAWLVTAITVLEVAGLLYVVYVASDNLASLSIPPLPAGAEMDSSVATGILLGSFLAFYAYIGFEDMVNIAEEIKQPEKVLPVAIVLALVIATLLYMLVAYTALSVLSPAQLSASKAPLADVVISKGYSGSWISLISLVAVINGAIIQIIMASRVIYGMASRELLPVWLASVNRVTSTPIPATLLCAAAVLILALLFPLSTLAQLTSLIVLSVFVLVNVALIRLNRRFLVEAKEGKDTGHKTVHFPRWIPYIGAFLCVGMLLVKASFWWSL